MGLCDNQNMLLCSRPDVIEGYILIILPLNTGILLGEQSTVFLYVCMGCISLSLHGAQPKCM